MSTRPEVRSKRDPLYRWGVGALCYAPAYSRIKRILSLDVNACEVGAAPDKTRELVGE